MPNVEVAQGIVCNSNGLSREVWGFFFQIYLPDAIAKYHLRKTDGYASSILHFYIYEFIKIRTIDKLARNVSYFILTSG